MFLRLLLILASVGAGMAVTVPFMGVLVRFRANYNPKGLQLDSDGNVQPHTGPIVTSYFAMAARVKRLEASVLGGLVCDFFAYFSEFSLCC